MSQSKLKTFEYYLILPPELRMMVVDEMCPTDRCRFSGCSKLSSKEAKSSKNYINLIYFTACPDFGIIIHIKFSGENTDFYKLIFGKKNYLRCTTLGKDLWVIQLDSSIDMIQYGTAHFINLLHVYQNSIKGLGISVLLDNQEQLDFGIRSLKNLERLDCGDDVDIRQFFSKIRRPLKTLVYTGVDQSLLDGEEIFQVKDFLRLSHVQLNYEQFIRLSAKSVSMHIGELTEHDILYFIKSWQKGKYKGGIKKCIWDIEHSNFDKYLLFRLVRKFGRPLFRDTIKICYKKDIREQARLEYSENLITLTMPYIEANNDSEDDEVEDEDSEDDEEISEEEYYDYEA